QQTEEWFQIELPKVTMVSEIEFDSPTPPAARGEGAQARVTGEPQVGESDPKLSGSERAAQRRAAGNGFPTFFARAGYPRAYTLQVSTDGTTWSEPVAEGKGTGPTTTIAFVPARAKFIRITQTASTDPAPAWSIQRLKLYQSSQPAPPPNKAPLAAA